MATLTLTLACGDYDRTLPLRTGAVRPDGVELKVLALEPEEMFYRMARRRDFDVAEFSLATYTVLRGRGEPLVAIPVFPSFAFRHSAIFVRGDAGIREPRDLVGKRVGVPKYHMTAAVWVRGILEDEYGVSPSDLHWFEGGEGAAVKEVDVTLPAFRHHLASESHPAISWRGRARRLHRRSPAGGRGQRWQRQRARTRAPPVPRLPPRGASLLREDGDLSDHAHGRPEGGARPGAPVAPRGALRGVHRGQAPGLPAPG
jgi:hypothetical protein